MTFDPKITQSVQDWLNTPEPERDIKAGADLMLSLNRNRALYNSIIRHPDKFLPKLVYELKKHLRMRLDRMSAADVARMEEEVMPAAALTLEAVPVISTDDEMPEGVIAKGKRADHDSLPAAVRELWDSNAERYERIKILFNELKAMSDMQPCDRYEKLVILGELDRKYRSNLAEYDTYVLVSEAPVDESAKDDSVSSDNENAVNNARKTLSKYRKKIAGLSADDPNRGVALEKIQNAVNAIYACGAGVAADTQKELETLGIIFK